MARCASQRRSRSTTDCLANPSHTTVLHDSARGGVPAVRTADDDPQPQPPRRLLRAIRVPLSVPRARCRGLRAPSVPSRLRGCTRLGGERGSADGVCQTALATLGGREGMEARTATRVARARDQAVPQQRGLPQALLLKRAYVLGKSRTWSTTDSARQSGQRSRTEFVARSRRRCSARTRSRVRDGSLRSLPSCTSTLECRTSGAYETCSIERSRIQGMSCVVVAGTTALTEKQDTHVSVALVALHRL